MTARLPLAVGTVGFDGPRGKTFSRLDAVEIQDTHRGVPGPALLTRLARDAGAGFTFVLRAPAALTDQRNTGPKAKPPKLAYLPEGAWPTTPFDTSELGQAAWSWLCEAAREIEAQAVLLQPSASFRPTAPHRKQITEFLEKVASPRPFRLIWDSQGLWSWPEQNALCRDLDLTPTVDPLVDEVSGGGQAYFRILGRRRSDHGLSADSLHRIAEAASTLEWGVVVMHTPRPFRDATSLKALLGEMQEEDATVELVR